MNEQTELTPSQRWRSSNKAKCRTYCAEYYQINKEELKRKRRERYLMQRVSNIPIYHE